MRFRKSHETGSLMVEVIAVIALLGIMGTMMFRQLQRRNDELDNINMASEIRMVKEATAAYIQANKAALETNLNYCPAIGDSDAITEFLPLADVEEFLPDNWIGTTADNGIINEYKIYLTCYRIDSTSADNRLAMYGTVVPNAPDEDDSPLPPNFTYRRAARVAMLIGADGGIFEAGQDGNSEFLGTMGAWRIDCTADGMCDDRHDNFYVATTGMDIYIPETDKTADNTVAVPNKIAFADLHSTNYFSVGTGNIDCVGNATTDADGNITFAHETLELDTSGTGINHASNDTILRPGETGNENPCAPLFWVGASAGAGNGHVYVKNNLYVGRQDNNTHRGIAVETGTTANTDNTITVFDTTGQGRLTLNGAGQIIGRVAANGKGYKLDAENGEIILFDEVTANVNGSNHIVQIPTLRLKDGRMETNVEAQYFDDNGDPQPAVYMVDPAGESLMKDIRLTSRGGARLSDILSDYILKGTQAITQTTNATTPVTQPTCPTGYAAAISVIPIRYSQYVQNATLNLNLTTNNAGGTTSHSHSITNSISGITQNINGSTNGNTLTVGSGSTLTLTQLPPVSIAIGTDNNSWTVGLKYGNQPPTPEDPITALAQTYCVFQDTTNRDISATESHAAIPTEAGLQISAKDASVITDKACTTETEATACTNTEKCVNGLCHKLGTCSDPDNTPLGNHIYCLNQTQVYLECFPSTVLTDCGSGKNCENNRCVNSGS